MGTRHLIAVIKNSEYKVAQYGQWDGYFSGQGLSIAKYLQEDHFYEGLKRNVDFCVFINKDRISEINKIIDDQQSWDGFKHMHRDTGACVLKHIVDQKETPIELLNDSSFGYDSLFCEFAYIINMDDDVLEVYEGFNQEPLHVNETFYTSSPNSSGYYGCKLKKKFAINESILASYEEFIEASEELEEEQE